MKNQIISVGTSWPPAGETRGPEINEWEEKKKKNSKNTAVLKMSCDQCQSPLPKTHFHILKNRTTFLMTAMEQN